MRCLVSVKGCGAVVSPVSAHNTRIHSIRVRFLQFPNWNFLFHCSWAHYTFLCVCGIGWRWLHSLTHSDPPSRCEIWWFSIIFALRGVPHLFSNRWIRQSRNTHTHAPSNRMLATSEAQLYYGVDWMAKFGTSKIKMYDFAVKRMRDECLLRTQNALEKKQKKRIKFDMNTICSTFGHNYTFVFVYMCSSKSIHLCTHTSIMRTYSARCLPYIKIECVHWKPITYLMANDDDNNALSLALSSAFCHAFEMRYYLILSIFYARRSQHGVRCMCVFDCFQVDLYDSIAFDWYAPT